MGLSNLTIMKKEEGDWIGIEASQEMEGSSQRN
jgi:hypothetical protein